MTDRNTCKVEGIRLKGSLPEISRHAPSFHLTPSTFYLEHLTGHPAPSTSLFTPPPLWAALLISLVLGGCDLLEPQASEQANPEYVVESYQIAGERMRPVRVMETADVGEAFDKYEMGVDGAEVEVQLLTEDGSVEERYPFRAKNDSLHGLYVSVDPPEIEPRRTYRLRVEVPGTDTTITAETTVPDTFRLAAGSPDSISYDTGEGIPIRVTRSSYPERQSYYLINNFPLDVREEQLTPAGKDLIDGTESMAGVGDDGYTLRSLSQNEWPITNESRYPHHEDGTLTVQFPWVSVLFYGGNLIDVHAVDDNVYDFMRSDNAQQGGGTPGEVPNVLDHVEGGTGLFGSMAKIRYEVYISR